MTRTELYTITWGWKSMTPQLEKKLHSYSNMRKPDITDCNHLRGLQWRILGRGRGARPLILGKKTNHTCSEFRHFNVKKFRPLLSLSYLHRETHKIEIMIKKKV